MPNEIKLEVYTIKIREKRTDTALSISQYFENHDFFDFVQDFITQNDLDFRINEHQKKSLQFVSDKTHINSNQRTISGLIESGEYGIESRIVNRKTKAEKYKKSVDDLDIKPFYYLISAPKRSNKGYLILQRLGGFGINSIFTRELQEFFKEKNEGLILEFAPFVSRELAKAFVEEGAIKEFILKRYDLPEDVAEKLGLIDHIENVMSIELRITAKSNSLLPLNKRVKNFIKNPNGKFFDFIPFDNIGFDGNHESTIKVKLGNNTRTMDLSDTAQIRPYYDIDAEVEKESSGHPRFSSIDKIAKTLIEDLINEIYS